MVIDDLESKMVTHVHLRLGGIIATEYVPLVEPTKTVNDNRVYGVAN